MASLWTLRRSTSDVKLAGLCGGLARQWDVDPVLVRVGWVLLALSGGIGLVLYLAGWLLLPTDGRETAPVDDLLGESARRWPREVWIAVVVIACVAAFALLGWVAPFGIGPALVIALIWYFGFYRPRSAARTAAPPPPSAVGGGIPPAPFRYPGPATPFTEAAEAWQRRVAQYQAQTGTPASAAAPAPAAAPVPPAAPPGASWPAPPPANLGPAAYAAGPAPAYAPPPAPPAEPGPVADPDRVERAAFLATPDPVGLYAAPTGGSTAAPALTRPGRRPSARRLGWATLLALGLVLAGLGTADYLGAAIAPLVYAAAALLVVGIALVLATRLGRPAGLLPLGTLLAAVVLVLGAATGAGVTAVPSAGLPAQTRVYTSPTELPRAGDALELGTLTVDLRGLELAQNATYRARVDVGTLVVLVPPGTQVAVDYRVDVGSVFVSGRTLGGGPELSGRLLDPERPSPGEPTLTLDLRVDLGSVRVQR